MSVHILFTCLILGTCYLVVQLRDTCMVGVAMADGKPARRCVYFASSTEEFTCEYWRIYLRVLRNSLISDRK